MVACRGGSSPKSEPESSAAARAMGSDKGGLRPGETSLKTSGKVVRVAESAPPGQGAVFHAFARHAPSCAAPLVIAAADGRLGRGQIVAGTVVGAVAIFAGGRTAGGRRRLVRVEERRLGLDPVP